MVDFVYVYRPAAWTVPKLEPQIIWDEQMIAYQFKNNGVRVVARHPLTVIEAQKTIAQLIEAYPPPGNWQP